MTGEFGHQGAIRGSFEEYGYTQISGAVSNPVAAALTAALDAMPVGGFRQSGAVPFAIRNVARKAEVITHLLREGEIYALASRFLNGPPSLVTAILFDKLPGANWKVPAHQDQYFPVVGSTDEPGWRNWSRKENVDHVEPPTAILSNLVALRIHLDDCPIGHGELQVMPGTHSHLLSHEALRDLDMNRFIRLPASRTDVIALRPLLVHRSHASQNPNRRRVLHVVYSDKTLPAGLSWAG